MKKYFIIALATFSLFLGNAKAYIRIDSNVGIGNPKQYDIRNYEKEWDWNSGATFSSRDPWLYSISDFSYLGGANGSYLNVNADYYFGIRTETSDSDVSSYLNSDLNTLKSSNLRCGVGDYLLNYDSSFSPEIKNFNVNLVVNNSVNYVGSRQLLYHVTFSYSQQIKEINKNSTNVWCSFVREPSNGLFAQPVVESSNELRYYYFVNNMSYSVTKDKVVSAINDLQKEQQKTNDKLDDLNTKQDKTNQELKDINDFISDDTEADVDVSSLATVTGLLPAGPVDSLLTIPLKFLSVLSSSFSGSCTPVTMNWVFDSQLTLPCFSDSFYNDVPSAIMTFLSIVPCAFILITYFKHLYKKVDRAVSMNTTADDEWGVI